MALDTIHADVERQALHLFHQDVERFRHSCLQHVLALDDGFVNPRSPLDIVTLNRQQFLQGKRTSVRLERPHFHFPESLPAVLCLAAQRLLSDERVRPHGTGMNLVAHQMVELQHVDVANHDILVEFLASSPIVEDRFPIDALLLSLRIGKHFDILQHVHNFLFGYAVENRRSGMHSEVLASHPQVGFEHLSDVHSRRHT